MTNTTSLSVVPDELTIPVRLNPRLSWQVLIGFCIAVVGFSGCRETSSQMTSGEIEAVRTAVIKAVREFEAAEKNMDVDSLLAFLSPEFYMYQDGQRVNYATVVQQMNTTLPSLQKFEPRFDDVEVIVTSNDSALMSMRFHDVIIDSAGETTELWGPTTFLWRRDDGHWKIAYADSDHYPPPSNDPN